MKIKSAHLSKRIIPIVVIIIIGIVSASYYFCYNDDHLIGEVEATILPNKTEVSGKILEMPIELGAQVKKGDVIAVIDSTVQNYAIQQLEISLEKKKLALSEAQLGVSGSTQAENSVIVAKAEYNRAEAAYQKAYQDYQNALTLYNEGAISKDDLNNSKLKSDSASYSLAAAKAQQQSVSSPASSESIELDIELIESQLRQMRETLEKYTIRAAADGVIMSKSYVTGDVVSPGFDLADIANDDEKYFVFYLPEELLNNVDYEQVLTIAGNGEQYDGVVKYIDVTSQFTPKDFQTAANKNKKSFKIKLLLPADIPLKPGESAELVSGEF
jgi:HlyD family secretion protein